MSDPTGPGGKGQRSPSRVIASAFVDSKLTPLIAFFSLTVGVLAVIATPRELDPTITVPMVQVVVAWPGHDAREVDERLASRMSSWAREIPTVEHVVSIASDDAAMLQIEFPSGLEDETAITAVNGRLAAHAQDLPFDAFPPEVVLLGSDDVPVLNLVFYDEPGDPRRLRRVVREIANLVERFPDVSAAQVIGGARRTIAIELDPVRLASHGTSAEDVAGALRGVGASLPVGAIDGAGGTYTVRTRTDVAGAGDLGDLVVGASPTGVVRLRDVAAIRDGDSETTSYVTHLGRDAEFAQSVAVALSVRKRRGSNATDITRRILDSLDHGELRDVLGAQIHFHVARDDGRIAGEKVTTLLEHMAIATAVVILVVGLSLGLRAALIVGVVIPVTLAFVPFVYQLAGFTLNRITLAAMIFAIGILVDDAIVVIENVHRRFAEARSTRPNASYREITLDAVHEVGSPTILATGTVIAALAPTAFVSGMLGEFFLPLPVGSSVAMLFSLVIALTVTPFLAYRMLRGATSLEHDDAAHAEPRWLTAYTRVLTYLLGSGRRAFGLAIACIVSLGLVGTLVVGRVVGFRNVPISDVEHMRVLVDMPVSTTAPRTHRAAVDVASAIARLPEIHAIDVYAGTPGPSSFLGIARGFAMRRAPHQAELQIELQKRRSRTSHDVAGAVRHAARSVLDRQGARVNVAEEPMGPPMLGALVAEVYAPNDEARNALAEEMGRAFRRLPGIVDVQRSDEPGRSTWVLASEPDRLMTRGIVGPLATLHLRALLAGARPAELSVPGEPEPVPVVVRLAPSERATRADLEELSTVDAMGRPVPIGDFARIEVEPGHRPRFRRDGMPVIFVTSEVEGNASSIYPMLDLSRALPSRPGPTRDVEFLWDDSLPESTHGSIRWAGDWTPTYEMNRDLGLAFLVVLFVIYVMLAAWYASYTVPFVVMLPIPLSLVGVIPGHLVAGLPLSGMGTIGVIALAGLMVRNSILIVDFARERRASGATLVESVMRAGRERARPILLTAATVVLGDGVLFFDPMLQGLGLSMASGALVSTLLTLLAVPVAHYWLSRAHEGITSEGGNA